MLMKHLNLGPLIGPLNWTETLNCSFQFVRIWKCQNPFPELQSLGFESSQEIEKKKEVEMH